MKGLVPSISSLFDKASLKIITFLTHENKAAVSNYLLFPPASQKAKATVGANAPPETVSSKLNKKLRDYFITWWKYALIQLPQSAEIIYLMKSQAEMGIFWQERIS